MYGNLNNATVGCQEGLVCTRVNPDRSECRPQNGIYTEAIEFSYIEGYIVTDV